MAEKKLMTEADLMAAQNDTLTADELTRKLTLVNLRVAAITADKVAHEVQQYEIKRQSDLQGIKARCDAIKAEHDKLLYNQKICKHMTGGRGLENWANGDGKLYGAATSPQELPTGEKYFLCWRCGKEFHLPSKRMVMEGKMTYAEYLQQEREFMDQVKQTRDTMAPPPEAGAQFGGIGPRFRIPKLERQNQKDSEDFEVWKKETGAGVVANAI